MYIITKQFDFCYGHRVWSQTLNSKFSLDSCLKCRHLHGHQGTINISLEAESLQEGMVTDFKHLNWFKKWLDDVLDHKFIMDLDDPLRETLFPLSFNSAPGYPPGQNDIAYYIVQPGYVNEMLSPAKEMYEGLVLVPFVPTSENLSKWLFEIVQSKMKELNVKVSQIEFLETPKSHSIYKP